MQSGRTALHHCVVRGDVMSTSNLLQAGCCVDRRCSDKVVHLLQNNILKDPSIYFIAVLVLLAINAAFYFIAVSILFQYP